MNKEFIPVLMGNDINVYSMARAFYEEYSLKSTVFCKIASGPCKDSDIINLHPVEKIDESEVFVEHINQFALKNIHKTIMLIGCGDSYVEVISSNLNKLESNIVAPYMDFQYIEPLTDKENFYKLCQENNIDHPLTTVIHHEEEGNIELNFDPPYVVKPSDSVEYWKHPFEGQDKVFIVQTKEEVKTIVEAIFSSGYKETVIIQEFIPGDDSNMRVLTCYSDQNARVKLMALGHVLLEEHTPTGIGNHAVILNDYNEDLNRKFKDFLEKINYKGFSNFDLKYDPRDGKYKAFELNPRQGRSNYYVTNSGYNLAKIVVDDYLNDKTFPGTEIVSNQRLWLVVPKRVAFMYVYSQENRQKMSELIIAGNYVNPLLYSKDRNIKRMLRVSKNILSHYKKFKQYYGGDRVE